MLFFIAESFVALVIAAFFGCIAGWLIWGGERRTAKVDGDHSANSLAGTSGAALGESAVTPRPSSELAEGVSAENVTQHPDFVSMKRELAGLNDRSTALEERVELREADVARLKAKLRKAVEEIERRTALATAARRELADERTRIEALEQAGQTAPAIAPSNETAADVSPLSVFDVEAGAAHVALTEEQIEERVRARTASLAIQSENLERRMHQAASRADDAERELITSKQALADAKAHAQELLADARREGQESVEAVRREAQQESARLDRELQEANRRAEDANRSVAELTTEVNAIRDAQASHLRRVQEAMRAIEADAIVVPPTSAASVVSSTGPATISTLTGSSSSKGASTSIQSASNAALSPVDQAGAEQTGTEPAGTERAGTGPLSGPLSNEALSTGAVRPPGAANDFDGSIRSLPGMTETLERHLATIGIERLDEVASWTAVDIARVQAWLPDFPGVIVENNWVEVATRALNASNSSRPANDGQAKFTGGVGRL